MPSADVQPLTASLGNNQVSAVVISVIGVKFCIYLQLPSCMVTANPRLRPSHQEHVAQLLAVIHLVELNQVPVNESH